MIFPTNEEWTLWEINEEHHKFFLLRWQEIFDENTFDSWQVLQLGSGHEEYYDNKGLRSEKRHFSGLNTPFDTGNEPFKLNLENSPFRYFCDVLELRDRLYASLFSFGGLGYIITSL